MCITFYHNCYNVFTLYFLHFETLETGKSGFLPAVSLLNNFYLFYSSLFCYIVTYCIMYTGGFKQVSALSGTMFRPHGIKLCKPLLNPSLINLKYLGLWNLSNLLFSNSHKPAFVYMFYSPEP